MEPTEAQIRAATLAKINRALACIQEAQNQLGTACGELSALMYGAPTHRACSKLYDRVHAFWYTVSSLQNKRGVRLDSTNIEGLRKALERQAAKLVSDQRFNADCNRLEGSGGDAVLDRSVS